MRNGAENEEEPATKCLTIYNTIVSHFDPQPPLTTMPCQRDLH